MGHSDEKLQANESDYRSVIEAAIQAPSADNNQPWTFQMTDKELQVHLDHRRAIQSDPVDLLNLMAIGAAVENCCLALSVQGKRGELHLHPRRGDSAGRSEHIATLSIAPGDDADPLHSYVARRATCRKRFDRRPVPENVQKVVLGETDKFANVRLDWLAGSHDLSALSRLVAVTDRIRFESEAFHKEFYSCLRFTTEEVERTRDGLDIRSLELPPFGATFLRLLKSWRNMRCFNALGLSWVMASPSAALVRQSGAVGILSIDDAIPYSVITGGRALQRVWLRATAEGLSLHPIASLPVYLSYLRRDAVSAFSEDHRNAIQTVRERFEKLWPMGKIRHCLMLFRIGYSASPSVRSLRRSVNDVVELVRNDATDTSELCSVSKDMSAEGF